MIVHDDPLCTLILGDCVEVMRELPAESVDAIVTDPPYDLTNRTVDVKGCRDCGRTLGGSDGKPDICPRCGGELTYQRTQQGKGFMGKTWDGTGVAFDPQTWREAFRVAKPGAHLLAFGGTRTYHRLASAIEDAGWEIRDCLVWAYASGFPKSLDVSKAIDKAVGAEREVVGLSTRPDGTQRPNAGQWDKSRDWRSRKYQAEVGYRPDGESYPNETEPQYVTAPATPAAAKWDGWGTALKPAWEPIVMARKPLRGTVAQTVLAHGTGALNIDATRIPSEPVHTTRATALGVMNDDGWEPKPGTYDSPAGGRWPANLILTDPIFDGDTPGVVGGGPAQGAVSNSGNGQDTGIYGEFSGLPSHESYGDSGTYSRFFLIPKSSRSDREPLVRGTLEERDSMKWSGGSEKMQGIAGAYPDGSPRPPQTRANSHPTVKPLDLMRHLVRLVTPPTVRVLYCPVCEPAHANHLSPVRADGDAQAESALLLPDLSGGIADEDGDLSDLRDGVSGAESDVLLAPLREPSTGDPTPAMRAVRDAIPAGQADDAVLFQNMRGEGERGEASGLDAEHGGLHPGVEPDASERGEVGLRHAAPSSNGGRAGAAANVRGSRRSHQPRQGRQPAEEPAGPDGSPAQQSAEATTQADHLSALPVDDLPLGTCSTCGGGLAARNRPGVVLDCFLGSGTTAIAANAEGFRCIGIEKEAEYLDIALARMAHQPLGLGLDVPEPTRKAPGPTGRGVGWARKQEPHQHEWVWRAPPDGPTYSECSVCRQPADAVAL